MSASTGKWIALGLAILHLCLATWFAAVTPYRSAGFLERAPNAFETALLQGTLPPGAGGLTEQKRAGYLAQLKARKLLDVGAPDERQHVNYVKHLLAGEGFPILDPHDPNLDENYQSHQPPAFYVLAAGWSKVTGASDLDSDSGGKRLRFLNALLGGGEVFSVFLLGWWGFKRPEVGVLAAAFAALLPMNVALSGAVNNDVLLYLLCTLTLAICALGIQDGWSLKRCLALGVCLALALLTKTTAVSLLPVALFAALAAGQGKPKVSGLVAAVLPIILLTLPWWVRNQHLYGDPLAMKAFKEAFPGSAQAKDFIDMYGAGQYWTSWVGWWTARSFFGVFGYMDIWMNETGSAMAPTPNTLYRVLIALSVIAFIGWIVSLRSKGEGRARQVQIMNVGYVLIVLVLFIGFNMQYFQAQARYILPAIGPIACGYALGALALAKERWLPALAALVIVLGGTTLYAGTRLPSEFEKRVGSV